MATNISRASDKQASYARDLLHRFALKHCATGALVVVIANPDGTTRAIDYDTWLAGRYAGSFSADSAVSMTPAIDIPAYLAGLDFTSLDAINATGRAHREIEGPFRLWFGYSGAVAADYNADVVGFWRRFGVWLSDTLTITRDDTLTAAQASLIIDVFRLT